MSVITNPPGLLAGAAVTPSGRICTDVSCSRDEVHPWHGLDSGVPRDLLSTAARDAIDAGEAAPAGVSSGIALAEEGITPTRAGRMEFDLHAEALATAARDLRDAELARIAAGKRYQEALEAFNRFVAPVTTG